MQFRQARAEEADLVAAVLSSAAAGLERKGLALWNAAEVSEAGVQGHVHAGMYHAVFDDEGLAGVFRFQLEDRLFWPEAAEGSSAFIHKLAVHPRKQGTDLAQDLLRHACELTRQHDRRLLRLDCMSGRPGLRAVYERFGFTLHSDKRLGSTVFHRFEIEVASRCRAGVSRDAKPA
jgi:GNAT superfamily N-acetyltransferase